MLKSKKKGNEKNEGKIILYNISNKNERNKQTMAEKRQEKPTK